MNTLIIGGLPKELVEDFQGTSVGDCSQRFCCSNGSSVYIVGKIREAQKDDKEIAEVKEGISKGQAKAFRKDENDTLWFEDRVYVPNNAEIRKLILREAHDSPYSIHSGNTKM